MEISGVSGSSSYDLLQQLQEEKDKKAAEEAAAASESAQVAATGAVTSTTAETTVQSTTQNVDTIQISAEGRAYQQQTQAPPPPKDSSVSEASSTEDTETSTVLTNLTEDEISQLVDDGTITQAEANAELARRAALEAAEKTQSDSDQNQEDLYIDNED